MKTMIWIDEGMKTIICIQCQSTQTDAFFNFKLSANKRDPSNLSLNNFLCKIRSQFESRKEKALQNN